MLGSKVRLIRHCSEREIHQNYFFVTQLIGFHFTILNSCNEFYRKIDRNLFRILENFLLLGSRVRLIRHCSCPSRENLNEAASGSFLLSSGRETYWLSGKVGFVFHIGRSNQDTRQHTLTANSIISQSQSEISFIVSVARAIYFNNSTTTSIFAFCFSKRK